MVRVYVWLLVGAAVAACSHGREPDFGALGRTIAADAEFELGDPTLVIDSVVFAVGSPCRDDRAQSRCAEIEAGLTRGFAAGLGVPLDRPPEEWPVCDAVSELPPGRTHGVMTQLMVRGEFSDTVVVWVGSYCRLLGSGRERVWYYKAVHSDDESWTVAERGFSSSGITG